MFVCLFVLFLFLFLFLFCSCFWLFLVFEGGWVIQIRGLRHVLFLGDSLITVNLKRLLCTASDCFLRYPNPPSLPSPPLSGKARSCSLVHCSYGILLGLPFPFSQVSHITFGIQATRGSSSRLTKISQGKVC